MLIGHITMDTDRLTEVLMVFKKKFSLETTEMQDLHHSLVITWLTCTMTEIINFVSKDCKKN